MKANKKGGGITHLLFAHFEKAIVLLIVGIGAYLVYGSLGIEGESRVADDLQAKIQQTRTSFSSQSSTWENAPEDSKREAYDPGSSAIEMIPTEIYEVSPIGWDRAIVPQMVDRGDPELLPAQMLEGTAVTGLMSFINEDIQKERERQRMREEAKKKAEQDRRNNQERDPLAGGNNRDFDRSLSGEENVKGRKPAPSVVDTGYVPQGDELIKQVSCAVIVAKAPALAQFNLYKDTLEGAQGYAPELDVPRYMGFIVERAEVRDGQQLDWKRVPLTDGLGSFKSAGVTSKELDKATKDWASFGEPLVDADYQHSVLTMPLPPLVGQALGRRAIHSEAPLQAETDKKKAEAENSIDTAEPDQEDEAESDIFARGGFNDIGPGDERGGLRGGNRISRNQGGFGGNERGGFGARSFGGERSRGGPSRGGLSGRNAEGSFNPEIPFQLVRFFDFTVVPGRQYQYRIRLVIADVNQRSGVSKKYLDRTVMKRLEATKDAKGRSRAYRLAEWSEPSSLISVPMAGDAFVVSSKVAGRGPYDEGSLDMLVQSFRVDESDRAQKSGLIKTFRRGSVMNMTEDTEVLSADRRWIDKVEDFEFRTGITICDFNGGTELTRDIDEPVRVLMMDASGRLFVRHQLDDSESVDRHRAIFEASEKDNRGNFGGDFGERGGYDF